MKLLEKFLKQGPKELSDQTFRKNPRSITEEFTKELSEIFIGIDWKSLTKKCELEKNEKKK